MHFSTILPLATAALAMPSKRDAQWGGGWGWPHGGGGPPHGQPHGWGPHPSSGSVAYFLENNPAGSNIVSLHMAENGTLSEPLRTSTGGVGSIILNATTGEAENADSLSGQGAVTISGNMLFTVNAGSNTVAMFVIDPENPYSPRLVGEPVSSQGEFPSSVTYSPELRKACVLNGGAVAGVSCYNVNPWTGLEIDGPLRQLSSSIINETTPPAGPPGAGAQVLFNPDSSALFATVKGMSPTSEGHLLAWPVTNGEISTAAPVDNQFSGVALDFGFLFINENTIFLSDAASGVDLIGVNSNFTATLIAHTPIVGQSALCWTEYDPSLNTAYAIDAGTYNLTKIDPQTGAITGVIEVTGNGTTTEFPGLFDSAIKDGLMYSLAAIDGIITTDLAKGEQVAFLDLTSFGSRQFYQGFAIWP